MSLEQFRVMATAAILSICAPSAANAQEDKSELLALRGMRAVRLYVPAVDDKAREAGVDDERLRTVVQLRLRQSGLEVRPYDTTSGDQPILPYLRIGVTVAKSSLGDFASGVEMTLWTILRLPFEDELLYAVPWRRTTVIHSGPGRMPSGIYEQLTEIVEDFLNTWLAANPR